MTVKLINKPTLDYVDWAIGECYGKGCYNNLDAQKKRIEKVALKLKHSSVLEFAEFIFEIEASTKVLLEMSRHRVASYACKSSRYTLNKGELVFEKTGDVDIDTTLEELKDIILEHIEAGKSNELTSLLLPQAYQYRWVAKFNARSLKNFLALRTDKSAHFMIREVALEMYSVLPDEVKYLFKDDIKSPII